MAGFLSGAMGGSIVGGAPYVVKRGDRLRGAHPLGWHMGSALFVADGLPESEWPNARDAIIETAEREDRGEGESESREHVGHPDRYHDRRPPRVHPSRRGVEGGYVSRGRGAPCVDPLVALAAGAFVPLADRLQIG